MKTSALQTRNCKSIWKKSFYVMTLCSLSNFWSQLFEHLCLFWIHTAAERSAPTLNMIDSTALSPRGSPLPASPMPPRHDTPPPVLLLPKPRSTVSSKGKCKPSSFYNTEKKCSSSKSQYIKYVPSSISPGGQSLSPSPPSGHSTTEVQHLMSLFKILHKVFSSTVCDPLS